MYDWIYWKKGKFLCVRIKEGDKGRGEVCELML